MSVVRGYGLNGTKLYSNIAMPMETNLTFTVTPTDGLGITALKSNGYIENVFMHTSTTPTSNNGHLNPNPAVGYGMLQLKRNFNHFIGLGGVSITPPNVTATKIDNTALTIGQVYVISTLGNATAAQWTLVGVPAGVTAAVGVAFVAIATTAGTANTSTSRVMLPSVSAVTSLEMIGVADVAVNTNVASNAGQYLYFQFLGPTISTGAYVAPMTPTAPATGSIVTMNLIFDGSSVTVDGL